jgi:hypothetical protein
MTCPKCGNLMESHYTGTLVNPPRQTWVAHCVCGHRERGEDPCKLNDKGQVIYRQAPTDNGEHR